MRKAAKEVLNDFKPVIEKYNSISKRKIADIFPQSDNTKKPLQERKSRVDIDQIINIT